MDLTARYASPHEPQIADELEQHLMKRFPPSMRLPQYRPKGEETPSSHVGTWRDVEKARPGGRGRQRRGFRQTVFSNYADPQMFPEERFLVLGPEDELTLARATTRGSQRLQLAPPEAPTPTTAGANGTNETSDKKMEDEREDEELVKLFGRRRAEKIAEGLLVVEDGEVYDGSLAKAMFHSIKGTWWLSVVLCGIGCKRSHKAWTCA